MCNSSDRPNFVSPRAHTMTEPSKIFRGIDDPRQRLTELWYEYHLGHPKVGQGRGHRKSSALRTLGENPMVRNKVNPPAGGMTRNMIAMSAERSHRCSCTYSPEDFSPDRVGDTMYELRKSLNDEYLMQP